MGHLHDDGVSLNEAALGRLRGARIVDPQVHAPQLRRRIVRQALSLRRQ